MTMTLPTPTREVRCPADRRLLGTVPQAAPVEIAGVAAELREAQPAWEALGPEGRGRHLLAWADWFLDNDRRRAEMLQAETGKAWNDAALEPLLAVDLINYFTRHARSSLPPGRSAPTVRPDRPSGSR